jgi:hypothetical protein
MRSNPRRAPSRFSTLHAPIARLPGGIPQRKVTRTSPPLAKNSGRAQPIKTSPAETPTIAAACHRLRCRLRRGRQTASRGAAHCPNDKLSHTARPRTADRAGSSPMHTGVARHRVRACGINRIASLAAHQHHAFSNLNYRVLHIGMGGLAASPSAAGGARTPVSICAKSLLRSQGNAHWLTSLPCAMQLQLTVILQGADISQPYPCIASSVHPRGSITPALARPAEAERSPSLTLSSRAAAAGESRNTQPNPGSGGVRNARAAGSNPPRGRIPKPRPFRSTSP